MGEPLLRDYPDGPVLLDTEVFIWAAMAPKKLSPLVRSICEAPEYNLRASPATLAEILIKVERRGLPREMTAEWCEKQAQSLGITFIPIRTSHIALAFQMPLIHKDPFDRVILATAIKEGFPLLTCDRTLHQYAGHSDVGIVW